MPKEVFNEEHSGRKEKKDQLATCRESGLVTMGERVVMMQTALVSVECNDKF